MQIFSNNGTNNTNHCCTYYLIHLSRYWYGWGNNLARYNGHLNTRRVYGDRTAWYYPDGQHLFGALIGLGLSVIIVYALMQYYEVDSANQIKFDYLKPIIGLYILWYLYLKGAKKEQKNKLFIIVGFISGLVSIFIGAVGPLIAPFFLRKDLTKENVIANKAACQIITHIGKIPIFMYFFNVNYIEQYTILLPLIISVYIGTNVGKKLLGSISEKTFKIFFKVCLTIIAIRLIIGEFLFITS